MATWIAHLRIAENILNKGYDLETSPFVVGNIGPDSGVPNEDYSSFTPSKKITHWLDDQNKINAKAFYDKYVNSPSLKQDKNLSSFILGYYVHLLTDIEWSKLYAEKKKGVLHKEGLDKDPKFIWTIKKDWYGLDFLYLKNNPKCLFFTVIKDIKTVPDYLDYFPENAFQLQIKRITEYYLGENEETKENFIYLNEKEMDDFIIATSETITLALKNCI
ncbi:MAG: zinc dependent phospholipase C family protein [Clostridium sp.]|uniref:zinc dependent phospholipase C family protein n=1 Tax=Clostridium sp. TaxID=1506 RepID=UPI003D6CEFAA